MAMFPDHERKSVELAEAIYERLKLSNDDRRYVTYLIAHHMDKPNDAIINSDKSTRRWVRRMTEDGKVPAEWMYDMITLMRADESAGKLVENPKYHFRGLNDFQSRVEVLMQAKPALSQRNLAVNGNDIMTELNIKPSPTVGKILGCLLDRVTEDPTLNTREHLLRIAKEC